MVEEKEALKFKGTRILLIMSFMIGAVYLFYILPHEKEKKLIEELSSRFFRVDVAEVEFLRIQNANGIFNIAREGNEWKLLSPIILPTDSKIMQKILEIITRGKITKIITHDIDRAAEFRLDYPAAALSIGYKGKIDELAIGGSNPSNTGFYAYGKGINAIFVVEKEIAEIATLTLYDIRSKAVFSFAPESVTRIRIIKRDRDIELKKDSRAWQAVRPLSGRASDEDISDFLLGILNQRAEEFYDNLIPDRKDYRDTIQLLFFSGEKISADIDVHYWGTDVNQGTVAYQQGMKYAGRLPRDFWNFVHRDASEFRYRNLFDFDETNVRKIRVKKDAASYELVKKGNDWYLGEKLTNRKKLTEFIWFLKAWKASKLLSSLPSFDKNKPVTEISLYNKDGTMIGTLKIFKKMEGETIGFAGEEEQFLLYAVSDNIQNPCAVSSVDANKIPGREDFMR